MLSTGVGAETSLLDVLQQWPLVEFDFQRLLGLDLDGLRHAMTWRRFKVLLSGLFGVNESHLRHHFHPDPENGSPASLPGMTDN